MPISSGFFSAAGWLIPLLSRLLNRFFHEDLPPEFQSKKAILLYNLNKLQTTLLPHLLIEPYANPLLEKYIQDLKYAFYKAEHELGLVEYRRLEKEVTFLFPSTSKFNLTNLKAKLPKVSEKRDLIKSLMNLEELVTFGVELCSLCNLQSSINSTSIPFRETISCLITKGKGIIGRDQDRDYIVKLLRENFSESTSNDRCYSVIGIWGMGGSGKTTLAQYVYQYEAQDNHFDLVIWAHVSKKFDVHSILKTIWESAFMELCPTLSLEELQSELERKLKGQRFFLVLDDVWCDGGVTVEELEQLFVPLSAGERGSKILVTTRIETTAKALGAMNPIPLRELDEDQFFSLFMSNALADNKPDEKLTLIGKKIAEKLCRLPCAAMTVAAQLRWRPDIEYWVSMLNITLLNDTLSVLYLSYQTLPPPLQRCFSFCSLFPKGHLFGHDHLIRLWIAEGFIEIEDANEHAKIDIANQYILDLVSCSLFQVSKQDTNHYFLHDLIHLLAQHVSQSECFQIESGEKKEIPTQTRHLYVVPDMLGEYVEKICKLKDLCTIVVPGLHDYKLEEVNLYALFMNLRKLCVVELPHIQILPKSVINLRNLRYLKFYADVVGESVTKLYQLRFLFCGESLKKIPNVGRLILLHELSEFCVRKRRGFELKQFEHLTNLFGSLSIYGLHHVGSKEAANQAKLSEKKGLQTLHFIWDHESEDVLRDSDVEILDGLCPPPQIREVSIKGYSCKVLPSWIFKNNHSLIHLECLELAECRGLEALPRLDGLHNLKRLEIIKCVNLTSLSELPPSVESISIRGCNEELTRSCRNPHDPNGKKISHILEKDIQP